MGHYHILRIDGLDWAHLDNPECTLYFKIWTPNHCCKTPIPMQGNTVTGPGDHMWTPLGPLSVQSPRTRTKVLFHSMLGPCFPNGMLCCAVMNCLSVPILWLEGQTFSRSRRVSNLQKSIQWIWADTKVSPQDTLRQAVTGNCGPGGAGAVVSAPRGGGSTARHQPWPSCGMGLGDLPHRIWALTPQQHTEMPTLGKSS